MGLWIQQAATERGFQVLLCLCGYGYMCNAYSSMARKAGCKEIAGHSEAGRCLYEALDPARDRAQLPRWRSIISWFHIIEIMPERDALGSQHLTRSPRRHCSSACGSSSRHITKVSQACAGHPTLCDISLPRDFPSDKVTSCQVVGCVHKQLQTKDDPTDGPPQVTNVWTTWAACESAVSPPTGGVYRQHGRGPERLRPWGRRRSHGRRQLPRRDAGSHPLRLGGESL